MSWVLVVLCNDFHCLLFSLSCCHQQKTERGSKKIMKQFYQNAKMWILFWRSNKQTNKTLIMIKLYVKSVIVKWWVTRQTSFRIKSGLIWFQPAKNNFFISLKIILQKCKFWTCETKLTTFESCKQCLNVSQAILDTSYEENSRICQSSISN